MTVEWWLQVAVLVLLGATLFHALRLERALGALRRDRTQLEALLAGLDSSTQEAQAGLEKLRGLADGAGRDIARQVGLAGALRDDLGFLVDRGERLAVRLDELVRTGRSLDAAQAPAAPVAPARPASAAPAQPIVAQPVPVRASPTPAAFVPPQPAAEAARPAPSTPRSTTQSVLQAMIQSASQSGAPQGMPRQAAAPEAAPQPPMPQSAMPQPSTPQPAMPQPGPEAAEARPVLRSQAERDLLLALRGAAA